MKLPTVLYRQGLTLIKHINKPIIYRYSKSYAAEKIFSPNDHTLIGRFALFLNNDYNKAVTTTHSTITNTFCPEIFNKSDIKSNEDCLKNLKSVEIEQLLYALTDKSIDSTSNFNRLLRTIDRECCSRMNTLDYSRILRLLNIYVQVVPQKVTRCKFYHVALNHLVNYVQFLSKEELLESIFYIGLQKKNRNSQQLLKTFMKHFTEDDVNKFSVEELCIICNACFKTSTKITRSSLLRKVHDTLNNNLYLLKDPALFITLIKTVRHNRIQDEDLLNTIACTVLFNKTYEFYGFLAICHILALYADFVQYDEGLLKVLVGRGISELETFVIQPKGPQQVRLKDVTRFLWVLCTLGYKDVDASIYKNIIVPKIMAIIQFGLNMDDVENLVCCILYLWILNYQAVELLPYALTEENVQNIREIKSKTKERLNLLLTCIYYENRKLFKEMGLKPQPVHHFDVDTQLQHRTSLNRVFLTLKTMTPLLDINKYELNFQVPHLNICGITGYKKKIHKAVHIEVIDDYVCVKNKSYSLIGPMQLKLRILNDSDEAVLTIYNDEIETMSEEELQDFLESELDLVC